MVTAPIPPLYPAVHYGFASSLSDNALFFGSGREAMAFLARRLLMEEADSVFVLPAYTCETVTAALEGVGGRVVFVDLDERLDMDLADLDQVLHTYRNDRPVLIPTLLFGAPVHDYKALYPQAVVVEDRCQSTWTHDRTRADFEFFSFGMGKLVSCMGGVALKGTQTGLWRQDHEALDRRGGWASAMAASVLLRAFVLRWGWRWFQSRLDAGGAPPAPITPRALSGRRARWITHSLRQAQWSDRIALADRCAQCIPLTERFDLPTGTPYLRYPVRKPLQLPGCSLGRMYEQTWRRAEAQRDRSLPGARALVACGLLPTHSLVTPGHWRLYMDTLAGVSPAAGG